MISPETPWPNPLLRHFESSHAARELARGWRRQAQTPSSPEATADFIVAAHHLLTYDQPGELLLILERLYSGSEELGVSPEWEYWLRSLSGRAFLLHGGRAARSRVSADAGSVQDGDPSRTVVARDLIWPTVAQQLSPQHTAARHAVDSARERGCQAIPLQGRADDFCGNPSNPGFPAYRLSLPSRSLKEISLRDDEPSRNVLHMLAVLASDESTAVQASRELSALLPKIRALPQLNSWHERLTAAFQEPPAPLPRPPADEKMRTLAGRLRDPLQGGATRYASAYLARQVLKHGALEEKLALVCASGELPSSTLSALLLSHYAKEPLVAVRRAIVWQSWQSGEGANELSLWAKLEGDPVARTLSSALGAGQARPLDAEERREELRRLGLDAFVVASLGGRHPAGSARLYLRALDGCPAFARTAPDGRYLVKSQLFPNESRDALASPPGP